MFFEKIVSNSSPNPGLRKGEGKAHQMLVREKSKKDPPAQQKKNSVLCGESAFEERKRKQTMALVFRPISGRGRGETEHHHRGGKGGGKKKKKKRDEGVQGQTLCGQKKKKSPAVKVSTHSPKKRGPGPFIIQVGKKGGERGKMQGTKSFGGGCVVCFLGGRKKKKGGKKRGKGRIIPILGEHEGRKKGKPVRHRGLAARGKKRERKGDVMVCGATNPVTPHPLSSKKKKRSSGAATGRDATLEALKKKKKKGRTSLIARPGKKKGGGAA